MLFFLNTVNAQSHKVGQANYNCKLNKKGWFFNSEKLSCPACEATDNKEKAAKAAEDKRRNDVVVAKAKADKIASDLANKKKQQEIAEKNKITEVSIIMPKITPIKNNASVKKTLPKKQNNTVTKSILLISDKNGGFKSINNEVIIPENTYAKTKGAQYFENINKNNFPKDLGIVTFSQRISVPNRQCGAGNYYVADFISSKGERHFNSDAISFIEHMQNDWFIIGLDFYGTDTYYDKLGSAKLYNVKTKKEFQLPISPWHNAVIINQPDSNSVTNPCYITGTYILPIKKRELREILLDNLTGGSDQWKAYIFLQISPTRKYTEFKVVYINNNDEIKELSISDEDRVYFKMN